jgi:hypothetical protein
VLEQFSVQCKLQLFIYLFIYFLFFHAPMITTKQQLKSRELFGNLTSMPKSVSEIKVCSMDKNLVCRSYMV